MSRHGGIQDEPSAPKSAWLTYVDVADATLQRATAAGATVTLSPQDTPFRHMAGLRDPFGAEFRIIKSAHQS
ncbi:VOC family protein [Nocardia sp. NPDC057440]|uniref:VOC family protein n=1 Tax=Nocardia sp. NPDC057440 TaxID=3346134 RepID=UPI003670985E